MKEFITLILFIGSLSLHSQEIKVQFILRKCDSGRLDYDQRNVVVSKKDHPIAVNPLVNKGKFELEGLEVGVYNLSFTNAYGQRIEKKNEIISTATQEIEICTDYFEETKDVTFFGQFRKKDTLVMYYHSSGCWHDDKEKYAFRYKAGKLHVDYFVDEKKILSKLLTKYDLLKFENFEKKLRYLEIAMNGCDTYDNYNFELNGRSYSVNDASCYWNGYSKLKSDVLGIK